MYHILVGRAYKERDFLYSMVQLLSAVDAVKRIFVGVDLIDHVGKEIDGFKWVRGGHGYENRNTEGKIMLEFSVVMN